MPPNFCRKKNVIGPDTQNWSLKKRIRDYVRIEGDEEKTIFHFFSTRTPRLCVPPKSCCSTKAPLLPLLYVQAYIIYYVHNINLPKYRSKKTEIIYIC